MRPADSAAPPPATRSDALVRARRAYRRERHRLAAILRTEATSGVLLVAAASAALILANTRWGAAYESLRDWRVGPAALGYHLTVEQWAADGLLALFFFLAGLELKQEFVIGQLRDIRRAVVPVAAAVGGMIAPAAAYLIVTAGDASARAGWAIPTATDIAFALAVLAVVGRHLPGALRTFLLALAVVDDLLAIVVIAVFFSHDVRPVSLVASLVAVVAFAVVLRRVRRRLVARRLVLAVLAVAAWALMFRSGVHATVAGVLLGFTVPVRGGLRFAVRRSRVPEGARPLDGERGRQHDGSRGDEHRRAEPRPTMAGRIDDMLRPVSAGFAVPVFAFFAAGVTVGGLSGLGGALTSPVALGVVAGLVIGKAVGILMTALVVGHLVRSPLVRVLALPDWIGVSIVGGVGFTVSLLIGHLAFGDDAARVADVQIGVVAGSLLSAAIAALILGRQSRRYLRRRSAASAT